MKRINKRNEPHELRNWKRNQHDEDGNPINCSYKYLDSETKEIILGYLLEEQGYICCYTGKSINSKKAHIEHLKPQSLCELLEDLDYNNLLAAFPRPQPGKSSYPYGAEAKGDQVLPITPLRGDCETRFTYGEDGKIFATNPTDQDAIDSIKILGLDDTWLTEDRMTKIKAMLYPNGRQPTEKYLERIIAGIYDLDNKQRLKAYCFAIYHAAQKLLERKRAGRQRRRYMNRD